MTENYGDDLRREMQKLRAEMGIDPAGNAHSGKKARPSKRSEKAAKVEKVASSRASEEPLLVTSDSPAVAIDDRVEDAASARETHDETRSPSPTPKISRTDAVDSKSGSKRTRLAVLAGASLLLVAASTYGYVRFDIVTAAQGIDTTFGKSVDRAVIVDTVVDVAPNDLVAALLPGSSADGESAVLIGTVFSENTETVAVYDGDIIWQIPVGDILGTVLFASATESL